MDAKGLLAVNASLYDLPFGDAVFDALWTMSTFVHVPPERVADALRELVRVVKPGGPIAIGTWGGRDFAGYPESGELISRKNGRLIGMSTSTDRLDAALSKTVTKGDLKAVAAAAWSSDGLVYEAAFGESSPGVAMRPDSMLWIASLTSGHGSSGHAGRRTARSTWTSPPGISFPTSGTPGSRWLR